MKDATKEMTQPCLHSTLHVISLVATQVRARLARTTPSKGLSGLWRGPSAGLFAGRVWPLSCLRSALALGPRRRLLALDVALLPQVLGTIVAWLPGHGRDIRLWHILHDDGDEEVSPTRPL